MNQCLALVLCLTLNANQVLSFTNATSANGHLNDTAGEAISFTNASGGHLSLRQHSLLEGKRVAMEGTEFEEPVHSDQHEDPHSPREHGLYWRHFGWLTVRANHPTDRKIVRDLAKYPELTFLDRFDILVPIVLALSMCLLGYLLSVVTVPMASRPAW